MTRSRNVIVCIAPRAPNLRVLDPATPACRTGQRNEHVSPVSTSSLGRREGAPRVATTPQSSTTNEALNCDAAVLPLRLMGHA
jgi:hypothetical protein